MQVRDYPNAGPKEYAFAARPFGAWNFLEFDIGVAVVRCNGQVIEQAWQIGNNPDRASDSRASGEHSSSAPYEFARSRSEVGGAGSYFKVALFTART